MNGTVLPSSKQGDRASDRVAGRCRAHASGGRKSIANRRCHEEAERIRNDDAGRLAMEARSRSASIVHSIWYQACKPATVVLLTFPDISATTTASSIQDAGNSVSIAMPFPCSRISATSLPSCNRWHIAENWDCPEIRSNLTGHSADYWRCEARAKRSGRRQDAALADFPPLACKEASMARSNLRIYRGPAENSAVRPASNTAGQPSP